MKLIEVIIADSNAQSAELTARALNGRENVKVSGIALNGEQAYVMIKKFMPQLVVLEPDIEKIDGFNLIKIVKCDYGIVRKPKFIILTHLTDSSAMETAFSCGADCVMLKPADRSILMSRIESMFEFSKAESGNDDFSVSQLLSDLGISARLKGYQYIAEALKISVNDSEALYGITKNLYPEIAKKYSTTAAGVEKAIRNAIDISWDRISSDKKKYIFGNTINPKKGKPTNYEMIAQLAQWLKYRKQEIKFVL